MKGIEVLISVALISFAESSIDSKGSATFMLPGMSDDEELLLLRPKRESEADLDIYSTSDWPSEPLALAASTSKTPEIKNINVQCEKTHILVNILFTRPFNGIVFSKGHYSNPECVHVQPGSGLMSLTFQIRQSACGTYSSAGINEIVGQPNPEGSYVENIVIIQFDPQVQDVFDQARKLRCTWYDFYEKSIAFQPFRVENLNSITANFLGDNLQCWMQIQTGKGPYSSEVSGIVRIGQTMTMVMGIKDEENKFDMLVRNCVAHDGAREPVKLVDDRGCVLRKKIMGGFRKIKNFGDAASVVSYSFFQAFKFPDSMNVHFQCVIQVCRYSCPNPECTSERGSTILPKVTPYRNRVVRRQQYRKGKREVPQEEEENESGLVRTESKMQVLSPRDLALHMMAFEKNGEGEKEEEEVFMEEEEDICLSILSFSSSIALMTFVIIVSTVLTMISCASLRRRKSKLSSS